ncbi:MAG TPA: Rieske 2Fe-2S domain-containing protein [Casimicrobiaceae bacterium]|nr:Rieske 2Fe-2S domain-containing protein [Casimicrobiaceae bacterium]
MSGNLRRLVDIEHGTASREIFVNADLYRQELEQIFARAWLFVGHESQVPNPDDFYVSRMGEDSVILTRDRQGALHVLLNSCRHRGMKLCRYDEGNTPDFTCPYHGWSYSTNGDLVSRPGEIVNVPGYKRYYHEQLDRKAWGLVPVAQMVNYKGTVWATWDADAPPFEDYLGSMRLWLDSALDHRDGREGGSSVLVGVQKWRTNCNWKFPATNFIGDAAHVISHRSVDMVGLAPGSSKGRRDERASGHAAFGWPDLGHGGLGFEARSEEAFPRPPVFQKFPAVSQYFARLAQEHLQRRAGRVHQQGKGTIFPNMSFHEDQPRTIIVHHPNGPTQTEFWRYYLVDTDAPDEVKDTLRHYYMTYSGPGGMTEQDDLENWTSATVASMGAVARRFPYNYQQGLHRSKPYDALPGAVWCGERVTEQNQLIWLKRWAEFMEGRDWERLMHRVAIPDDPPFPLLAHE